jgi:hypothetical protein
MREQDAKQQAHEAIVDANQVLVENAGVISGAEEVEGMVNDLIGPVLPRPGLPPSGSPR